MQDTCTTLSVMGAAEVTHLEPQCSFVLDTEMSEKVFNPKISIFVCFLNNLNKQYNKLREILLTS